MKQEQDNFEALQRLLKLKRHEVPPPGYFNDFSSQVIRRIKLAGKEDADGVLERLFVEAPWIQRIFGAFHTKPAVAWSFGLVACALVVSSIVYSETVEVTPVSLLPAPSGNAHAQAMATAPMILSESSHEMFAALSASTNPVIQPATGGSLFNQFPLDTQPAGFIPGAR